MFLSSQLEDVSRRYPRYVTELRGFLISRGLLMDALETLPALAARLSDDRAFCRGVSTLLEAVIYREQEQISYADLLGILIVAAQGTAEPASSVEQDESTHYLLGFLMHLRESMRSTAGLSAAALAPAAPVIPIAAPEPAGPVVAAAEPIVVPVPPPAPVQSFVQPAAAPFSAYEAEYDEEPEEPWWKRNALLAGTVAVLLLVVGGYGAWHAIQNPAPVTDTVATALPAVQTRPAAPAPEVAPASEATTVPQEKPVRPSAKEKRHAGRVANAAPPVIVRQAPVPRSQASAPATVRQAPQTSSAAAPAAPEVNAPPPPAEQTASSAPVRRRLPVPTNRPRRVPGLGTGAANTTVPLLWTAPTAAPAEPKVSAPTITSTALGVMASNLVYSPTPSYPAEASAAHVEGQVKVEATVGNDGSVTSARVVSGPPQLRDAALGAVQRWHYRPYVEGGKARTIVTTAVLEFQLP